MHEIRIGMKRASLPHLFLLYLIELMPPKPGQSTNPLAPTSIERDAQVSRWSAIERLFARGDSL